jgi:hypothetical protein
VSIRVAMTPVGPEPPRAASFGPAGRTAMKNRFPNPSLEDESVPGRPDYLRQTGSELKPWERIGGSNNVWGLSGEAPYHGGKCLVMVSESNAGRFAYLYLAPDSRTPEKHVFSMWLRASQDGLKASIRAGDRDVPVTVTTRWQRYSVPFTPGAAPSMLGVHFHSGPRATLWADAFQAEQGEAATAFEP